MFVSGKIDGCDGGPYLTFCSAQQHSPLLACVMGLPRAHLLECVTFSSIVIMGLLLHAYF